MSWLDFGSIVLSLALALVVLRIGFAILVQRDLAEGRRNLQEACSRHVWLGTTAGFVCQLCGKVAGVVA